LWEKKKREKLKKTKKPTKVSCLESTATEHWCKSCVTAACRHAPHAVRELRPLPGGWIGTNSHIHFSKERLKRFMPCTERDEVRKNKSFSPLTAFGVLSYFLGDIYN